MVRKTTRTQEPEVDSETGAAGVNTVRLVGRLAAAPLDREMPSGDRLVVLRLVVPRPPTRTAGDRRRPRSPVDTIDVACWSALTRRAASRLEGGELVEVTGALRRRFYRAGAVALSRYEVEARSVRRLRDEEVRGAAGGGGGSQARSTAVLTRSRVVSLRRFPRSPKLRRA